MNHILIYLYVCINIVLWCLYYYFRFEKMSIWCSIILSIFSKTWYSWWWWYILYIGPIRGHHLINYIVKIGPIGNITHPLILYIVNIGPIRGRHASFSRLHRQNRDGEEIEKNSEKVVWKFPKIFEEEKPLRTSRCKLRRESSLFHRSIPIFDSGDHSKQRETHTITYFQRIDIVCYNPRIPHIMICGIMFSHIYQCWCFIITYRNMISTWWTITSTLHSDTMI